MNAGKVNSVSFTGVGNLVGGTGEDTFKFSVAGSVSSLDGGGAPAGQGDWLDYSAYTSATSVTVNLAANTATGVSGAINNIQNMVGGAGSNNLTGNALGNILIGGSGTNVITGGSGRSILIGGSGSATITGGADDDIVIGGSTSYDHTTNHPELMAILQEWQRADEPYQQRISNIRGTTSGGLNGSSHLTSSTVKVSSFADTLYGGPGLDWFWANLATASLPDLQSGMEQVN